MSIGRRLRNFTGENRLTTINADFIQTLFDRVGQYGQARAVNKTGIPFCTTPDALGEDTRAAGRELAGGLSGALRQHSR